MACEIGAVAGPSGLGGFERALWHHVQVRNARCASLLQRREDFFHNQIQAGNSALPRIAGGGVKTAGARFCSHSASRTCGLGAAAAPRKPASIAAQLERVGMQGYGFTRLRSPKFLGENDGSRTLF